jgi:flavin reductase
MTKPVRDPKPAPPPAGSGHAGRLAFREGMSRVAGAVHIVTTDGQAGKAGLTVTAFASVCDDPPVLLVCVNRESHSAPRLIGNGVFCVNTLAAADQHLADVFAGRTGLHLQDRFEHGHWGPLTTGAPVLANATVVFDCRITDMRDVATHHVIFGEVMRVAAPGDDDALLYWKRDYRRI